MTSASVPLQFRLAGHVRACACDESVVLLDLRSNRYLGIDERASQSLAYSVVDWPNRAPSSTAPANVPGSPHAAGSSGELLRRLCAQGLLVTAPELSANNQTDATTRSSLQLDIEEAIGTIDLDGLGFATGNLAKRARQTLRFTASVATAACWLRYRSLQRIASTLAARRSRGQSPLCGSLESMKPAMEMFERLRPLVFTSRSQCLLDSLALMRFLGLDGFMPRWVVGVRLAPFAAHSWVQCGPVVLNDQHEFVRQFHPILVV